MTRFLPLLFALAACSSDVRGVADAGTNAYQPDSTEEVLAVTVPSAYRPLLNTAAYGDDKVVISSDLPGQIIFPPGGLADFSLVAWVRLIDYDPTRGMLGKVLDVNEAGGHPNFYLILSATPISSTVVVSTQFNDDAGVLLGGSGGAFTPDAFFHQVVLSFVAGDHMKTYIDAVEVDSTDVSGWVTLNPIGGGAAAGAFTTQGSSYPGFDGDLANVFLLTRALTAAEVTDLYGLGVAADVTVPVVGVSDWTFEVPPLYWFDAVDETQEGVLNSGSAGNVRLGTNGGPVASLSLVPPTSTTRRGGNTSTYPPVTTWLKTTGETGSRWTSLDPAMSRLLFPDGGGLGVATIGFWVERSATPLNETGTMFQVGSGLSNVTVTVVPGNVPTVTATDGTHTASLKLSVINGLKKTPIILVSDGGSTLVVYVDGLAVGSIDVSAVSPADADWGLSFTVGAANDGSSPVDEIVTGIWGTNVAISAGEASGLVGAGWTHDVRDPVSGSDWQPPVNGGSGTSPLPVVYWRDVPDESTGEVPGAIEGGAPLIPFRATTEEITDGEDVPLSEDVQQFAGAYQELLPPGPVWETETDPDLALLCEAVAQEQARLKAYSASMVPELRPFSTSALVSEWEEVLDLPDDCAAPPSTLAGRQAAIAAAFLSQGGQTTRYMINLLEQAFGVSSYIQENWPYLYFRVGDGTDGSGSEADDYVGSMTTALTFRVNVTTAVSQETADHIECLINRVKPSHTAAAFNINVV